MEYTWRYTAKAIHELQSLDPAISARIVKKIAVFCSARDPFVWAQPLQGPWKGLFRFRIGDYRAIFRKEPTGRLIVLLVLSIKHRREVYE